MGRLDSDATPFDNPVLRYELPKEGDDSYHGPENPSYRSHYPVNDEDTEVRGHAYSGFIYPETNKKTGKKWTIPEKNEYRSAAWTRLGEKSEVTDEEVFYAE